MLSHVRKQNFAPSLANEQSTKPEDYTGEIVVKQRPAIQGLLESRPWNSLNHGHESQVIYNELLEPLPLQPDAVGLTRRHG